MERKSALEVRRAPTVRRVPMYKIMSWRSALIFMLVWLFAAIIFLGYWPSRKAEGEYATITNSEYDFSVEYPTKWRARTYGETGYKGEHTIRLLIHRSDRDLFEIAVRQRPAKNSTLEDVIDWGSYRINDINHNLSKRGELLLTETFLQNEMVNNTLVAKRQYSREGITNEDVYIARSNDMIIITLQASDQSFSGYTEEFDRIVESFRPKE